MKKGYNSCKMIFLHEFYVSAFIYQHFSKILAILFFFIWFSIFSNGIINLSECAHRLVFKKRQHCDLLEAGF